MADPPSAAPPPLQGLHNFIKGVDVRIGKAANAFKNAFQKISSSKFPSKVADVKGEPPVDTLESRGNFYDTLISNQMKPWLKNPFWEEREPTIQVFEPAGFFCQMDGKFTVGLPPGRILDILADPENTRIFKNIKELLHRKVMTDDGEESHTYVEQAAIWRFLWLTGTFEVCLNCSQNRRTNTIYFSLSKPGFMKKFEGSWHIYPLPEHANDKIDIEKFSAESYPFPPSSHLRFHSSNVKPIQQQKMLTTNGPRDLMNGNDHTFTEQDDLFIHDDDTRLASVVVLKQCFEPAITPPFFLKNYVRGITASITKQIFSDLQKEAMRLRYNKAIGWTGDESEISDWKKKPGQEGQMSLRSDVNSKTNSTEVEEGTKQDVILHTGNHVNGGKEKKRRASNKTKKWRKRVVSVE